MVTIINEDIENVNYIKTNWKRSFFPFYLLSSIVKSENQKPEKVKANAVERFVQRAKIVVT